MTVVKCKTHYFAFRINAFGILESEQSEKSITSTMMCVSDSERSK